MLNEEICKKCVRQFFKGLDEPLEGKTYEVVNIKVKEVDEEEVFISLDTEWNGVLTENSHGKSCDRSECPFQLEHMVLENVE